MARLNMIKATKKAINDSPFSGVAKGFDEGNIASLVIVPIFRKRFGIDTQSEAEYANTKGWIVAIATAGAVVGCLACVWLTQRLGRTRTFQLFTLIYIAGVLGQAFSNGNLAALYATRVIAGIGIGATTVLPSVYITEIAPQSIRSLLTLQYTCCQQLGVVFGFFFNYGITRYRDGTDVQWMLPTALQAVPAVIWGVGTLFTPETPRFLLMQGRRSEALATLCRFRGLPEDHEFIQGEFQGMETQLNHEIEVVAGADTWDLVRETFADKPNRRRFILMFACHVFGQWSVANAITQYSPSIFGYLGIQGTESRFLATGMYAVLNRGAIAAIYLHAVAWSIGWFSIPYLVSAEVFPLRIRSINMSVLMAVHWAMYFGCSRAMPSLLAATDRYGAFIFFLCVCSVSLVYVYLALPETSGRSLESMDKLFDTPWYQVHKIAYPTADDLKPAAREIVMSDDESPKGRESEGSRRHVENRGV
ncbi:quinate permease [Magnaporthiopsis poae ATCC 64411]|uniref:Quinate permease n=1 Tax=Magnaporthiopsis poae (strain ATCC 64411 / 73-15) TaxID=644358 RepID=A0A0C4EAG7_MAGP6|nr:quinate permease [Magnaporthiopsis poae ATCC 64411]